MMHTKFLTVGPVQVTFPSKARYNLIGLWAVEVAKRYPTAEVIGIDTSPVTRTDTPANCEFIVGDIIKSLANFDDESFDFVHSR